MSLSGWLSTEVFVVKEECIMVNSWPGWAGLKFILSMANMQMSAKLHRLF